MGSNSIANARWADIDYIADRYAYEPGKIWIGRSPHRFADAIGHKDSRHVLVCAGSGSGKGRSFIINNLSVWPGSVIAYDPKGDLPQILAARRAQGDDYADGMEQDVFVLDPLGKTGLGPEYLGWFDPLQGLDPNDGELPTWAKRIAQSLIEIPESSESAQWARRASRLIALIIQHVVTSYSETEKNLSMVLQLLMEGAEPSYQAIKADILGSALDDETKRQRISMIPDPMMLLFEEMLDNDGCRGWIAKDARNLMRIAQNTPKFFESVRGEATDQLDWLKSEGIEISLSGKSGDREVLGEDRKLDPLRLKTDPSGISVFIVMPLDDMATYRPWLQTLFLGLFAAMRSVQDAPASGHQTLCVLDEFLSLGYQDYIADAMDNIRGAGTKLVIIVQNFGKLKKLYADEIDSFYSNTGLELYFGKVGDVAGDHLLKQLGETEVVKEARNTNSSRTSTQSDSRAQAHGQSRSETDGVSQGQSTSEAETSGWQSNYSTAQSSSDTFSWSDGVNWSDSRNWGQSSGNSMGRNYGPHVFFEGLKHSNSYGTQLNRNQGRAKSKGGSSTKGGSRTTGETFTEGGGVSGGTTSTVGRSSQQSKSWQTGRSFTETQTSGTSESYQIGEGVAQSFHKKPLLEIHEMNIWFRDFDWEDRDHPAYPGLALVRINGELPFFVRRSNYDQDPYFERCFGPDTAHGYIPLNEVPTLGYQYTPDHIVELPLPQRMADEHYRGEASVRRSSWVDAGQELMVVNTHRRLSVPIHAPIKSRVLEVVPPHEQQGGQPMIVLRTENALSENDRDAFRQMYFKVPLAELEREDEKKRVEDARKRREQERAEEERRKAEARKREEERLAEQRRQEKEQQGKIAWQALASELREQVADLDRINSGLRSLPNVEWGPIIASGVGATILSAFILGPLCLLVGPAAAAIVWNMQKSQRDKLESDLNTRFDANKESENRLLQRMETLRTEYGLPDPELDLGGYYFKND